MNEDYLWDRSGPPDAEIVRLERALKHFRLRERRPAAPWWKFAAIAAAVLTVIGVSLWQMRAPAWKMTADAGAPEFHRRGVTTDAHSRARLTADAIGQVDLGPDSELSIASDERLSLRSGRLHAFIWAPPARFTVDTPAARAIDLGCEYTLETDRRGDGLLQVQTGWVAFDWRGHESFIPAQAACRTYHAKGPGTPWFRTASPSLTAALDRFDRAGDAQAIPEVLASAQSGDALTLWHLLARAPEQERPAVYDRLASLMALPPGIDRNAAIAGRREALDRIWNALNLGNADFWRGWKRRW